MACSLGFYDEVIHFQMLDKHPLLGPKGGPPFCNNSTHQEASGNLDERDILQNRVPVLVPSVSVVKNLPANAGDVDSVPEWGRFPGEGNGNPLQYSCLGNPMGRGAWRATVHGVTKSQTGLSDYTTTSRIDIQPGGAMAECRKETYGGHFSVRLLSSGVPESGM